MLKLGYPYVGIFLMKSYRIHISKASKGLKPDQVAKAYNFPQDVDVSKQLVTILELG